MKAAKRFKTKERERQKSREKEQKNCFEEEILHASFESNINTVVGKHLIRNHTS